MADGNFGNITATGHDSGKRHIVASTDRAVQASEGSGIASDLFVRANQKDAVKAGNRYGLNSQAPQEHTNIFGYGIGGNITSTSKDSGKRLIVAGTDRAVQAIEGSGVSRIKKAGRWEQFANATIRDGIDTAGKAARVYYGNTGPIAQLGFGLRKRSPRKKRSESPPRRRSHGRGGALYPAGIP
jgi:hypothetical protein